MPLLAGPSPVPAQILTECFQPYNSPFRAGPLAVCRCGRLHLCYDWVLSYRERCRTCSWITAPVADHAATAPLHLASKRRGALHRIRVLVQPLTAARPSTSFNAVSPSQPSEARPHFSPTMPLLCDPRLGAERTSITAVSLQPPPTSDCDTAPCSISVLARLSFQIGTAPLDQRFLFLHSSVMSQDGGHGEYLSLFRPPNDHLVEVVTLLITSLVDRCGAPFTCHRPVGL